ncbi:hypothetical protein BECAL_02938 [Bellilinea caldifistulae]|uniref:DUF3168 domain-containing protein n=1 Tax=Bellilinea caldifistulae TaxID=360411 RepID=A0A0P6X3W7_9CHLR|nr:hypothetical protein [Bellilinea caldifistulae]KPL74536.1 hypothetical protein AC812_12125 [Bellilinea caldifistulae]GAP11745.1 hypothetical protein BECAL_02938 [Bellilinea caldifistulae]
MTIWERIYNALAPLGLPMAAGAMIVDSESERPDTYLVYFLVSSPPVQHADDNETLRSYLVQVSVYSRNGLKNLPDIAGAMKTAGFTQGARRELPYNPETRHYGLAMDFNYLEEE